MVSFLKNFWAEQILYSILLIAFAALLGFANAKRTKGNFFAPPPITASEILTELANKLPKEIGILTTAEAKKLFEENIALFIDARHSEEYAMGHIEDAISCPENEGKVWLPDFLQKYPITTELVVYCNGAECNASEKVALLLHEAGYTNIKLYAEGYSSWMKSNK